MDSKTKNENRELVAASIDHLFHALNVEGGVPAELILAEAHAAIVTSIAQLLGGEVAYLSCLAAGEAIRPTLSPGEVALAAATPAGCA